MPPTQKHAYSPEGSSSKDHDDRGEQKRGPLKDMYVRTIFKVILL